MTNSSTTFRIIGIGASAGGLEALQNFLTHLTQEMKDHAFIIAQHVSPTYKSMLVPLLAKSSHLPVLEAENGGEVSPGFIYVTPPDTEIMIENGKFLLKKPNYTSGPKPSIDTFFQSLGECFESRAIGIILSGTGSDGASGIVNVKQLGGLTIAQDPKTAKFDGMPISAIETGQVDLILAPEEMGEQILLYIHAPTSIKESEDLEESESAFYFNILLSLSKFKGTDFSTYKQTTVMRRVKKRIETLQLTSIGQYQKYLEDNPEEYELLFETILIGVTSFYRDEDAFLAIEEHLEQIISGKVKGDSIRIWAPGCSTGEEAYSIASILANLLKEKSSHFNIQIFATDIDDKAIEFARKATYPNTSSFLFKSIPDKSFLIQKLDSFEISKQLRSMVLFTKHDLTKNPPFLKLDMVICRNLLIYFGQSLQQQIIPLFHYALNANGILFLGKSETIGNFTDLFITLDAKNKIYQRKRGGSLQTLRFAGFKPNTTVVVPAATKETPRKEITVSEMVKETLYNTFDFPYVVITENYNVEMINGDVNLFLKLPEGVMNANILKMIRPELQSELRFTITKVIRDKEAQKSDFIKFSEKGMDYLAIIRVKPLLYSPKNNDLFMVVFEYFPERPFATTWRAEGTENELMERASILEKELSTTKEHLQIYIEELETSNEELQSLNEEVQSTNEELQSTNEELETTVEELQSTNEEIQIAYTELKSANEELERKDQIVKIKESSQAALLNNSLQSFILTDNEFKVIAFNDKAKSTFLIFMQKHIKIGDDLLDLMNLDFFPGLDADLPKLAKGEIIFGETKIQNQHLQEIHLAYNFSPVLDLTLNLTVISISFLDITFTKKTEISLRKAENLLTSVFNAVHVGICITDHKGIYINVNEAYCKLYGYSREELIGQSCTIVALPEYQASIKLFHDQFIAGNKELPKEWTEQKKDGSIIDVFSSSELLIEEDGTRFKVTSARDITEKKKFQKLLLQTQETAHVGGWEYDTSSGKFSLTSEAYRLFGLQENSVESIESIAGQFNELEEQKILHHFQGAINDHQPFDILCEYKDLLGNKLWYRTIGSPKSYLDSSPKIYGSFQDVTDTINYELQIKNSKELLEQTNETARVGGWDIDLKTNEVQWTSVTRAIHEVPTNYAPLLDEGINFYREGENRDKLNSLYNRLISLGKPFDDEFEIITYNGNKRWVRVTGHANFENGVCIRVFGAFQDIHDRKVANEAMRVAKERYDFLTQATREAIWDWDMVGNTLFWGEGFRTNFGYNLEDQSKNFDSWQNTIHPEDQERILRSINESLSNKEAITLENEYRFKKADGNYTDVNDKSLIIRNADGLAIRMVGAIEDISKRKFEETRLRLFESLIINSYDGVFITEAEPFDEPGPKIVYANPAMLAMTGYTEAEMLGKTPRILQGKKTSRHELDRLRSAMEKWETCQIEVINYKRNGEEFWNQFSVVPLANEKGWFTHWISIEKDITERKLEEEEKEKLIAELTKSNKDLKQFTYITSHNLRAPLSNLTAALNIIDDIPIENEMLSELLKGFRISTDNLNQTINDLIKILIIKDSPALEQTPLLFQDVYESVKSQIQNIIDLSGTQIETNFDQFPTITFNKTYLESIFLNLLTNSIKYRSHDRSPRIKIRSSKENNRIRLSVEDNGLGIDLTKHKAKVFGLYQRFHDLPDSKGLGLYLVKSQVEALGGKISLESKVGVGSTFTIDFKR
jgi:two-component system CheB/CheR fusion protein